MSYHNSIKQQRKDRIMNTATIEQYREFLLSRNYVSSTINGYIRVIANLEEPTSNDTCPG